MLSSVIILFPFDFFEYLGTSETEVFDEQSPSGNDYLAEVVHVKNSTMFDVNQYNSLSNALLRKY